MDAKGGKAMQKSYISRQLLVIFHQLFSIVYICIMAVSGYYTGPENAVPFCLLTFLFADAAYISYKNIKNNSISNHFTWLLFLLGWQFLFSLYEAHTVSAAISIALLPLCCYQTLYFLQAFVFQASAYRFQKQFKIILTCACMAASIGFFISNRAFAIAYQMQLLLSLISMAIITAIHFGRICFVIKSQKKQFIFSAAFVLLPFICYAAAFQRQPAFLAGMGSYLAVMLVSVSIHSIVFRYHPDQEQFFALKNWGIAFLAFVGMWGLIVTAGIFRLPLTAVFLLIYIVVLLILLFNLLLYVQISRHPEEHGNYMNRRHFYSYSLAQLKREEALRKDFSNYLHDNILQDLLSIKNLLGKAQQPEIKQLLHDTLSELISSLRLQMQTYHPSLLKNLTFHENIQNLLDTLTEKNPVEISLDCSNSLFLVEPYNMLIYRMIQELVTNALKHADATRIQVLLAQEQDIITLKVLDNGKGFERPDYSPSSHRGLDSIQEQAGLLDGSMSIHSASGSGTKIRITMPMKGENSYENFIGG